MKRIATVLALLAAVSCKSEPAQDPNPVGEGKKIWPDVPIAKGLDYKVGEGEKTPDASIRVYRMELRGGLKLDAAVTFYKDILPGVHHWTLVDERGDAGGPVTLVFEKDKEKLTLDAKKASLRETVVNIKIGPK